MERIDFSASRSDRLLALVIMLGGPFLLAGILLTGADVKLLGVELWGPVKTWGLLTLSCALFVMGIQQLRKIVRGLPDLRFNEDELIAYHFPFTRRVPWSDIIAVSAPTTSNLGFGNKLTQIVVQSRSQRPLRLLGRYREADPQELHRMLVERWHEAMLR